MMYENCLQNKQTFTAVGRFSTPQSFHASCKAQLPIVNRMAESLQLGKHFDALV